MNRTELEMCTKKWKWNMCTKNHGNMCKERKEYKSGKWARLTHSVVQNHHQLQICCSICSQDKHMDRTDFPSHLSIPSHQLACVGCTHKEGRHRVAFDPFEIYQDLAVHTQLWLTLLISWILNLAPSPSLKKFWIHHYSSYGQHYCLHLKSRGHPELVGLITVTL